MTTDPNDSKMMSRRVPSANSSTVVLNFQTSDATRLREAAAAITIKGDKKPSLSVIARRSLVLYMALLMSPESLAAEIKAIEALVTPVPAPAPKSKRKITQ
jgi:hypothetical protein